MKKIAKPAGNIRLVGQAEKDGVAFQAMKFQGPARLSVSGILSTVEENGNITCSLWGKDVCTSPLQTKTKKLSSIAICTLGVLALLFMVAYFFLSTLTENSYYFLFDLSYTMIAALHLAKAVSIFVARICGDEEIKNLSKFLAAKNAVENAYYNLGRIPTLQEVKTYSTFSYYSDYISRGDAAIAALWFALAVVHPINAPWQILILIPMVVIIFILGKKNLLFFWQFLTISRPEDIHYQAALTALEECLVPFDSIHINIECISIEEALEMLHFDEEDCKGCPHYAQCKERSQKS